MFFLSFHFWRELECSLLSVNNICSLMRDSHLLKTPVSFCSCCLLQHIIWSQSHHCDLTACAVLSAQGQGSLHHSSAVVCKEEVDVKGLCNEPDGSEAEHVNTQHGTQCIAPWDWNVLRRWTGVQHRWSYLLPTKIYIKTVTTRG